MFSPNPSSHLLSCSDPAIERSIEMQEEDFRNAMEMKTFKCWVGVIGEQRLSPGKGNEVFSDTLYTIDGRASSFLTL